MLYTLDMMGFAGRRTTLLVALLMFTPLVGAEPTTRPTTTAALSAEVRDAVAGLDRPSFADREEAQRALYRLAVRNAAARVAVEAAASDHASDEVRARAGMVLDLLRERDRFGETRVTRTIDGTAADALNVLQELLQLPTDPDATATQKGGGFGGGGGGFGGGGGGRAVAVWENPQDAEQPVTIELVDVPFWDAVETIGREINFWPGEHDHTQLWHDRQTIGLRPTSIVADDGDGTHYVPAVRVELMRAARSRNGSTDFTRGDGPTDIQAAQNGVNQSLHLQLRMLIEPKIMLASDQHQLVVEEAVDADGRDLLPTSDANQHGRYFGRSTQFFQHLNLNLDAAAGAESTLLRRLQGRAILEVAEESDTFGADIAEPILELARLAETLSTGQAAEIAGEDAGPTVPIGLIGTAGGSVVELEAVTIKMQGNRAEMVENRREMRRQRNEEPEAVDVLPTVSLRLLIDSADMTRLRPHLDEIQVFDAQDRPWQSAGNRTRGRSDEGKMFYEPTFADYTGRLGPPVRVEWTVPTSTRQLSIPFMFENVPLPAP